MIPNMYKIAGELTSAVFHVAARSLAAQGLSIFGDHSDVMAARSTGWGQLFAASVQEVMDFALISQAAALESRVPFIHIFDGFRTSHEVQKVEMLTNDDLRALLDADLIAAHANERTEIHVNLGSGDRSGGAHRVERARGHAGRGATPAGVEQSNEARWVSDEHGNAVRDADGERDSPFGRDVSIGLFTT